MSRLGDAFGMLIGNYIHNELLRGTVESVDKKNKTCNVLPVDGGAAYVDVKLTAAEGDNENSLIVFPEKGSTVYIGIVEGNEADAFVAKVTAVESVQFFDGSNGGMCITPELVKNLKRLSARVDRLENAIKNAKPVAQDGGVSLQQTMNAVLNRPMQEEDFGKIEDKRIQH